MAEEYKRNPPVNPPASPESGVSPDESNLPGLDATKSVGMPGKAQAGKIDTQTGEYLDNEKFALRKEERDAVAGYDSSIAHLNKIAKEKAPESEEDRQKRERRERSKKIIGAVSNGLSAVSNLFFTHHYAPNAYNHANSMLGKVNERIEAQRKERKADEDYYNNVMIKLGELKNARAATLANLKARRQAQKLAEAEEKRKQDLHPYTMAVEQAKGEKERNLADKAGYDADTAKTNALYAPKQEKAKLETEEAKKKNYIASAGTHNAQARKYNAETENILNEADGKVYHFNGRVYYNPTDLEKDVYEEARKYNERHKVKVTLENGKEYYEYPIKVERSKSGGTVGRPISEFAGEVETRLKMERQKNDALNRERKASEAKNKKNKGAGYGAGSKNSKGAGYGNK